MRCVESLQDDKAVDTTEARAAWTRPTLIRLSSMSESEADHGGIHFDGAGFAS